MAVPQKQSSANLRTVAATGRRTGPLKTSVDVRNFEFTIDEPEKLGGQDEAPTPMEYVTGALGGCFTVTIELVAKEFQFSITDIEVNCRGSVDHRGLFGTANVSPHFQDVQVHIKLQSNIPPHKQSFFQGECLTRCPVYNLIKDSGAPITVDWDYLSKD